jgi:putative ABC transport system permease protein
MKTSIELLNEWKKELRKQQFLEDGIVAELEDHILNEVKVLEEEGYSTEEAFNQAKTKIGNIKEIAGYQKSSNSRIESNTAALLRSTFKVATRHFGKNKLTGTINLGGLVVAFISIFFIALFIYDELSFEKHHPESERIHRLSYSWQLENGTIENRAFSSGMWVDLLKARHPAVEDIFRFVNLSYGYIQNPSNNQSFYTEGVYWSDPNFFDFLNFDLKYGQKEDQLQDLSSIILSEKTATKIFGNENPMGESLKFFRRGNEVNLVVTGVIYDPPSNSQFQPDYIANLQAIQSIYGESDRGWIDKNPNPGYIYSYVRLSDNSHTEQVLSEMSTIWNEVIPDRAINMSPLLTPIVDIHFNKPMRWEPDTPIDMNLIYGLMIIGLFILIIVLTNFTNLITAQSSKRRKEIGLRKTLGSTKWQLSFQFFNESIGMVGFALILSLIIVYLLTPNFNNLIGKNIDFLTTLTSLDFLAFGIPLVLFILLYSGILPAIYFTKRITKSFNLTDFFDREKVNSPARNALVIVQFTVAIILVISTVTLYKQLNLINNGSLGKNREAVIGIRTSRMGDINQAQLMKSRLSTISGVIKNTLGMHLPRQNDFGRIDTKFFSNSGKELFWNKFDADGGFITTYDLELMAGRDFTRNIETNALIANEAAVRALNLTSQEALGMSLREDSINYVFGRSDGVIVGVVKDFAYKTIKEEIEPLIICANNEVEGVLSVKLGEGNKAEIIAQIQGIWDEIYPNRPFEYWFLDKEFERMYSQERRLGRLIPMFSALAIIIAMLGLFALTLFISELRKKEIGIRKILGCSSFGILKLLSLQFLGTIIPAIIIALPIAYFGLNNWLNSYIYRVEVSVGMIAFSVLSIVFFSVFTVSFKSINAARMNPVENLKYE